MKFTKHFKLIITLLIITVFVILSLTEYILNKNSKFEIRDEYKKNKIAVTYFYSGFAGNILPFILSFLVIYVRKYAG